MPYISVEKVFGLRAKAKNFSMEDMKEGVEFAHQHGVKVYVTANILAHNQDLEGVRAYFAELKRSDRMHSLFRIRECIGLRWKCARRLSGISVHRRTIRTMGRISSGMSRGETRCDGKRAVAGGNQRDPGSIFRRRWRSRRLFMGRCVFRTRGRCLLSNYFTGRDANQGLVHIRAGGSMRSWKSPDRGEYLPVYENERGTYIFNSKDLCMIEHIPDLLDAGIDSYKIEGRMKTALYVATVARTYRKAIDDYLESPKKYEENMEWYRDQISNCTYRQFTTGFFYGKPDHESQIYDSNTYVKEYTYLGIVGEKNEKSRYAIEQRNKFSVGEEIEVMKPDGENVCVTVKGSGMMKGTRWRVRRIRSRNCGLILAWNWIGLIF